ncbi:MAG: S10 family peptidase [Candidatus Baltobacteraceae bacterium]
MKRLERALAFVAAAALLAAAPKPQTIYIPPAPPDGISHGVNHAGGQTIPYTARAGTITLRNPNDQITARMFYVAYTKDGASAEHRPITFFYNGGPGSSTIWLRMASYGPVRVALKNGQATPPAPYTLLDNRESLLDKTDEVFVDAPNTGYSRVLGYGKPADFIGVDQDGRAFTQFIQRYLTQSDRWNSPKFLFGESYGTTRDAVLVNMLQESNIQFNGVVFLSAVLNFGLTGLDGFEPIGGGDWAYALYLPTEAAVAWYHHRVANRPADLHAFLNQVQRFAAGEYLHALAAGDMLTPYERDRTIAQLHRFTGLSETYLRDAKMRVPYYDFQKELLRSEDRVVGRYDGRYSLYDQDQIGDNTGIDASDVGMNSAVVSSWNGYVRGRLHYSTNSEYRPTAYGPVLGARWDMHHNGQPPPLNVVPDLASAMSQNPNLRVFLAGGYYDFATPYYAAYYTFEHMDIAPQLQRNITYGFFPSGHMVYLNPASRVDFKAVLSRWYDGVTSIR